ncbi:hypothetical protein LTR62_003947 [Meristemomyces frigidus]|uniref:Mitochondrial thiamine pyrophosphate carrier 1 n=1 Tax=Meristemomyces frigidus TaxID=1508187 RepID=A0AAN7TFT4_9PEZI|nr:hypothetical protein LTR62_003947 [Meristemomyces frigidus]
METESAQEREARLRALWRRLDTHNANKLDLPALQEGLKAIDHPLQNATSLIRDMLTACDINHDGTISYEEFGRFCIETERQLRVLFDGLDRDRDGRLDKSELQIGFERAGVRVEAERLERFFGHVDRNRDGTISFGEWRDFLLFIPASTPGLKAVFNYYTSTHKLTAEGDVQMSDQAINGAGMTLVFFRDLFFGAIVQLVPSPSPPPPSSLFSTTTNNSSNNNQYNYNDTSTAPAKPDYNPKTKTFDLQPSQANDLAESDPHIPLKPARRKHVTHSSDEETELIQELEPLTLTDLVPDVGYFIAGGLSGITSRTVTAPLDRLKVYLIAQTGNANEAIQAAKSGAAVKATQQAGKTLWKACGELWAAGGIRSLFAGNGINVVKVMPESAVKFGSYEACKRGVAHMEGHNDPTNISQPSQFVAGGVAGMISQAVVYPLDTLKFRMQCETVPGGQHGNALLINTARRMWASNGVVAFYRGLPMGLVGMFPYAAIDLFTFETLKKRLVARNMKMYGYKTEEDALPGNFTLALMGGFSGAIGASIVYPINLLRTRLQSQGTASHPRTYTGIADVTRQTIRGEGFKGLFKGLTPNLLKVVPAVSIVSRSLSHVPPLSLPQGAGTGSRNMMSFRSQSCANQTYVVYENCKKALHLH